MILVPHWFHQFSFHSSGSTLVSPILVPRFWFHRFSISISVRVAEGGKRRIHITNDLNNVVDDEEDEAWKQWSKKSPPPRAEFDPSPMDFSSMDLPEIQNEMLKRQLGPVFGFVKLRLDVETTPIGRSTVLVSPILNLNLSSGSRRRKEEDSHHRRPRRRRR
ncbi:unnamed protein product [Camellia sinensis]